MHSNNMNYITTTHELPDLQIKYTNFPKLLGTNHIRCVEYKGVRLYHVDDRDFVNTTSIRPSLPRESFGILAALWKVECFLDYYLNVTVGAAEDAMKERHIRSIHNLRLIQNYLKHPSSHNLALLEEGFLGK